MKPLMTSEELIALIHENDSSAKRHLFEQFYGKFAPIANRYAKNLEQAKDILNAGLSSCLVSMQKNSQLKSTDLETFLEKEFIMACVAFVKNIRQEYYVATTVYADTPDKNYNLFENNELIDFNRVETEIFIKAIQQLVPSQRLIFNLHAFDGHSLQEVSAILEASGEAVKSNLEKARYNLQKNIKQSLKP